jgi:hypothetical protein
MPKMALAKHQDMVKAIPSDRSDQPLRTSVLSRRSWCDRPISDAHDSKSAEKGAAIGAIPVANDIAATIERSSPRPVGERSPDRRTGVQCSQHDDRGDRRASELRRDIGGDTGEAKHLDVQHLSSCTHRFEVFSAVVPQTKVQTLSDRGLLDHVSMAFELVTDCGSNEIGPVRVKALLNHQSIWPAVSPQMGANLIIVVFAVVVIGGMGSIMGAILTGFGLGLIEGLTKVFFPEASNTVIFIIMAIVLLIRPAGLFGRGA